MSKKKILSLILCCFMVLSVGCSAKSNISSEQEQLIMGCMKYSRYAFDNSFADEWHMENKLYEFLNEGELQTLFEYAQSESPSEFSEDAFGLFNATGELINQRIDNDVLKKDKETSDEYQNFIETFNRINEKYSLGFDSL